VPAVTVSAIVVNYRRPDILGACLSSLREALARTGVETELVVVDNASGDESLDVVARVAPEAIVLEMPSNLGFPTAVSEGIRRSTGEWALLINNDVIVEPDAVRHLLDAVRTAPDIGSAAAQMRFAGGRAGVINSAGIGVDRLGIAYDRLLGQPVEASETEPVEVFGACCGAALLRRTMLDQIGGFDESFFFALDDADLAWRAQMLGWRCLYVPAAVVHHHHGATVGHGSSLKYFHVGLNRVRMLAKNADTAQLRRYGAAIVAYDLAYIVFAGLTDHTLAPLRGRVQGLREWPAYRRAGAARRPVELAPTRGLRAALARRAAWLRNSAAHTR
jgi:GT2 family glycosyltransferase